LKRFQPFFPDGQDLHVPASLPGHRSGAEVAVGDFGVGVRVTTTGAVVGSGPTMPGMLTQPLEAVMMAAMRDAVKIASAFLVFGPTCDLLRKEHSRAI